MADRSWSTGEDFNGKTVFWLKLFLGALFTKFICTFLIIWYVHFDFLMPHSINSKKNKFSSLRRDNELFRALKKVKNGRYRSKFRKTVFYKQILYFHCPSKILCHTSNLWNFVKITGPYYLVDIWQETGVIIKKARAQRSQPIHTGCQLAIQTAPTTVVSRSADPPLQQQQRIGWPWITGCIGTSSSIKQRPAATFRGE